MKWQPTLLQSTKLKCRMLIQNEFLGLSSERDLTSTPKLSAPSIPRSPGVTDSTQHVANQPETTQGLQEATSCFQVFLQLIILVEPVLEKLTTKIFVFLIPMGTVDLFMEQLSYMWRVPNVERCLQHSAVFVPLNGSTLLPFAGVTTSSEAISLENQIPTIWWMFASARIMEWYVSGMACMM